MFVKICHQMPNTAYLVPENSRLMTSVEAWEVTRLGKATGRWAAGFIVKLPINNLAHNVYSPVS